MGHTPKNTDYVRTAALRNLVFTGLISGVALIFRDLSQQMHTTSVGVWVSLAVMSCLYYFRSKLGVEYAIKIMSLVLTGASAYLLQNMGLISGAFVVLLYNACFIGLLEKAHERYILLIIAAIPLFGYTSLIYWGYPAPMPENIETFAADWSSWLVKSVFAIVFAALVLITSSNFTAVLTRERENYRHSLFNSMTQLSLLRDQETGEHIERCSEFSGILLQECKRCNFDVSTEINAETMCEAVKLHDVGKVALSDTILQKPGKLTDGEFERMKRHTTVGSEIIIAVARANKIENDLVVTTAADIALSHHENWDGSGYPQSIAGRGISLASRIMAIVDVYDALRSERPYKKAFSHSKTLEIMTEMRGQKFDPELFDIFMSVADRFETTYEKLKSPIA